MKGICDVCKGRGQNWVHLNSKDPAVHGFRWITCRDCDGSGKMSPERLAARKRARKTGRALRVDRLARGLTLGQEARRLGIKPSELSARESGDV